MVVGIEIERKFLVDAIPAGVSAEEGELLRQGYLALDGMTEVRLRLQQGGASLTIKHGGGRTRIEEALELDERQAEALWPLTDGRRVEKVRRRVDHDGHTVEIDEYSGALAGLCVAEVEFADEASAAAFGPPGWFGAEVTDDDRYKNRRLACDGRPEGIR